LIEYTGERITSEEAAARYDDASAKRHHTFLFEIDEDRCIDARERGSDARFINHSCEPNCEAILDGDRIFIHSVTRIPAGAELTYDYRYVVAAPLDEATRRLYACKCGAASCRGTIAVARREKPLRRKRRSARAA